ncbi:unnamed protein product [Ostreobium quekettii]|uniref:Large ribosomal subunit protein mL59 domain-containing protein n=1 Tax=Ostreobium quekettii TaxID=121088 RepID=A0A8S1IMT8_9CHLO|nr:unnamed protein product [Ostreobium quekettii]
MSTTSAARVLEKLGEAALKRFRVDGKWKKAPLSARQIAKLRKECLLLGGEWPYEHVWPGTKKPVSQKKPKGHKWEAEKVERQKKIEENMKQMPKRIAEYKESLKLKNVSLLDQLTLMPKQIRQKYRGK